jgi:hypothetical protein
LLLAGHHARASSVSASEAERHMQNCGYSTETKEKQRKKKDQCSIVRLTNRKNDQEIAVEEIKSKLVDGEKKIRRNQLTVES